MSTYNYLIRHNLCQHVTYLIPKENKTDIYIEKSGWHTV